MTTTVNTVIVGGGQGDLSVSHYRALGVGVCVNAGATVVYFARTLDASDKTA
jgi:hypothetical protein